MGLCGFGVRVWEGLSTVSARSERIGEKAGAAVPARLRMGKGMGFEGGWWSRAGVGGATMEGLGR